MEILFDKRDDLLWKSWGIFPREAFTMGLAMRLPEGRVCKFMPCENTPSPALKPVRSEGYRDWIDTRTQTRMVVTIRPLTEEERIKPAKPA